MEQSDEYEAHGESSWGEAGRAGSMSYGGVDLEVDALVSTVANLIVVTTGVAAIDTLGAALEQVTLTPLVAERIAGALREALVLSDPLHRAELIARWQEAELSLIHI